MNAQLDLQPDLFYCSGETRAVLGLARRSDPDTSHIAAERTTPFRANHAGRILAALQDRGPMTVDQIAKVTELTAWQTNKRLPELERTGVVTTTGETRLSASGRPERVWRAS